MVRGQGWRRGAAGLFAAALCGTTALAGVIIPASAAAAAEPLTGAWLYDSTQTAIRQAAATIGADDYAWNAGYTGKGVGIALIDTGVAPVPGLTSGNVVNGPDLSFESQDSTKRYIDTYGHGTHLAGIIAGRPTSSTDTSFLGIAHNAKLTSVKVGIHNGAVDVTQVLAAIDWVVAHRNDDPANPIRIINLAYGTDGTQGYKRDPLTHAVQNAWRAGIVVVVAGGNDGAAGKLVNPAYDPFVLSVGAQDTKNSWVADDDTVADFTTRGSSTRRIDLVAPGRSIVSLRAPNSTIDLAYPGARVGTNFFRGSGSSQATAVTSGAVALLLQKHPRLTPDQVKAHLKGHARNLDAETGSDAGIYYLCMTNAMYYKPSSARQTWTKSTGRGVLEKARGTHHLVDGSSQLIGEKDIFGAAFDVKAWAAASSAGTAWSGGSWMGRSLTGTEWTTASGGLASWSGRAWSGRAWSGRAWSGSTWSAIGWLGKGWA